MRIAIHAVGRLKSGPERDLADRYLDRAGKIGRSLGITAVTGREWPESRALRPDDRKAEEAAALLAELPEGAALWAFDERGDSPTSTGFAADLARLRDAGRSALVFAIGGADGHGPALLDRADRRLAFGRLTLPHQIVRILAAEQVYRALTILSGHPYHRD